MGFIKQQIKNLFAKLGIDISFRKPILENVFEVQHVRPKVLMSYIREPFLSGVKQTHTKYLECYIAAEIFDELGFHVDVAHCLGKQKINFDAYEVIYGFGDPLEDSFYGNKKQRRILYSTGCNPRLANKWSCERLREAGTFMPRSARLAPDWSLQRNFCDSYIILGNQFVLDTWNEDTSSKYKIINCFYHQVLDLKIEDKDFDIAKKNILWFGSAGCVHKGLDLAIEAAKKMPQIHLHICGAKPEEIEFFNYYKKELNNEIPNITFYGTIDLKSETFLKLMQLCGVILHPSVSEGGAPSVLTAIGNGGLIPIIPESCGLDLSYNSFMLDNISVDNIILNINKVLDFPSDLLKELSISHCDYVKRNFSLERYKQNLKSIIHEEFHK